MLSTILRRVFGLKIVPNVPDNFDKVYTVLSYTFSPVGQENNNLSFVNFEG
jgi:hypothetical protein